MPSLLGNGKLNTSMGTLDEKGTHSQMRVIYGYRSFPTLTSEWCALQIQTRPLVREGALHQEASTCQTKEHVKSGHGSQRAARHQDILADWPSAANSAPLFFIVTVWKSKILLIYKFNYETYYIWNIIYMYYIYTGHINGGRLYSRTPKRWNVSVTYLERKKKNITTVISVSCCRKLILVSQLLINIQTEITNPMLQSTLTIKLPQLTIFINVGGKCSHTIELFQYESHGTDWTIGWLSGCYDV
jgi:hypothetical protein